MLHTHSSFISNGNDVRNQQDSTTFLFINLFNSALHVSGDKFAHPQELFLTLYTAFGIMYRHCCRPVAPVGSSVGALYKKLYIQPKRAPEEGRICHPKHVSCCILLVAYIVVLMMHGHTNVKRMANIRHLMGHFYILNMFIYLQIQAKNLHEARAIFINYTQTRVGIIQTTQPILDMIPT